MNEVKDAVYLTGFMVWFATCWYLNTKLKNIGEKMDKICESIDNLK